MGVPRVLDLGSGRLLIDLDFRDSEGLVAAYLLPHEGGWSLLETGPASCRSTLLQGLAAAGVAPSEVRRVFVTHIHLDHAGGMGSVVEDLPRAEFYAHVLGVPHLVDPTRLVASARRTWGAAADPLWGPIVPVPVPRIHPLRGGERFPLTGGELEVIATPGHAKHHLAFHDSGLRGVFAGDGAGVRLEGSSHVRPAVPPPDLDLDQLFASLEAMARTNPRFVLLSHFGPTPDGPAGLRAYRAAVTAWHDVALGAARESSSVEYVARRLREYDESTRATAEPTDRALLVSGYDIAAQGFLRYFETRGILPTTRSLPPAPDRSSAT